MQPETHMPTLTIKGMPDALYQQLKQRAAEHRRSLNSEILFCLEQTLATPAIDATSTLARVDALRERLNVPPVTEGWLRSAKVWGRL